MRPAPLLLAALPVLALSTIGLGTPGAAGAETRPSLFIDSGSDESIAADRVRWSADEFARNGSTSDRGAVGGTSARVYDTIRYGLTAYNIPLPDGQYEVTLRFAETYHDASGKRVFDVRLERETVLEDLDVFDEAGGRNRPLDKSFVVDVTGRNLDIDFTAEADKAMVSAISVEPADEESAPVPPPAPAPEPAPAPKPEPAPKPAPAPAPAPAPPAPAPAPGAAPAGYPFSDSSIWRKDISKAPLDARSAAMSKHLRQSLAKRYGGVAAFNVWDYNNSYYVAKAGQARTSVKFDDCQNKGHLPRGWNDQLGSVPIPSGAVPAAGNDQAIAIYSPETDQLWELWRAEKRGNGWQACWGGRIDNVSKGDGIFEGTWGATATGLAHSASMVSIADVRAGSIEHAIGIAIPEPKSWKTYSWPAQRSDGFSGHPDAVPEGSRLRLDPSVDVEKLNLHPLAEMVAVAAQQYGFVVIDKAGTVAVTTESGKAEEARTGKDPWKTFLGGSRASEVMEGFPWDKVQVLPKDYGKP